MTTGDCVVVRHRNNDISDTDNTWSYGGRM